LFSFSIAAGLRPAAAVNVERPCDNRYTARLGELNGRDIGTIGDQQSDMDQVGPVSFYVESGLKIPGTAAGKKSHVHRPPSIGEVY
jgi:hypothetical protein